MKHSPSPPNATPRGRAVLPAEQAAARAEAALQTAWRTVMHLDRWRAGDPAAFDTLYRRFGPLLRSRVTRSRVWALLQGRMQPEDVTQEIWARAIPAAQTGFVDAGPGSFLGFLGKIADRTMIDLARRLCAQRRGGGAEAAGLQTDWENHVLRKPGNPDQPTPTNLARASELAQLAKEVLPADLHSAWHLVEVEGFTAEEAGLGLRRTASAVRGLLLRARARLMAQLQQKPRHDRT